MRPFVSHPSAVFAPTLVGMALAGMALATSAVAQNVAPSFNCNRATFPDEHSICGTDRLAEMDQAATSALGKVPRDVQKSARESAVDYLKDRHACGTNRLCILDNQALVIDLFVGSGAHVRPPAWIGAYRLSLIDQGEAILVSGLPSRVGTCTKTTISLIGTRFTEHLTPPSGEGDDQGTTVEFADGGHQVSYTFERGVYDSKVGDPVMLCLVSLPKDCPKGDDRGKFYSGTNLRTKGSWILPDSQHMCGGT